MTAARRIILENKLGQKVRAFRFEGQEAFLVYRHDSGRVELFNDLAILEDEEIQFTLLQTVRFSDLEKSSRTIEGFGQIHLAQDSESLNGPSYALAQENDESKFKLWMQKSALGHLVAVIFLVALSFAMNSLNENREEPQLVTIVLPEKTEVKKVQKVQVSEKKVPTAVQKHAKVTNRTVVKPKALKNVQVAKVIRPTKSQLVVRNAPAKNLQRIGALAALGGIKSGAQDAQGLDSKSLKNIRAAGVGTGGGGVGDAGQGGVRGMMPGSGLIAGSSGRGGKAESAGGYGTRGSGGGKAGYGTISLVGGTSGIGLPSEEAEVQGGLDIDQIAAVINKNRGQIVYCYEQGLQAQAGLKGRVSVQFIIGKNGRITMAEVAKSSLRSQSVENCIVSKMKAWQFPRPVGEVNVDVLYPFDLYRVSSR